MGVSDVLSLLACFVTELLQYKLNKNCQIVIGIMFVFYLQLPHTMYSVCSGSPHKLAKLAFSTLATNLCEE